MSNLNQGALNAAPGLKPMASMASMLRLSLQLLFGEWRAHPVRALVAIAAIAIGVALGFAIHLINAAAFNEFSSAVKSLSGQADIQVQGLETQFDETIYPWLARHDGVTLASPVLEIEATVPGQGSALKIIGLDALRAGFVTPDLIGAAGAGKPFDTLADDAVFLSPSAQTWLKLSPELSPDPESSRRTSLTLQAGTQAVVLRVAGSLQHSRIGQRVGVMDLGALQWRFKQLGRLSRIDLKLRPGVDRAQFQARLAGELAHDFPGRFLVSQPNDASQNSRNDHLSRAYRVNLTVLALVALFTGAFLVFSTQALSIVRRRSQFALLRVLGLGRGQLLRQVLLEGASLGVAGALLGIGGGYAIAATALHFFGGDLGAGYFSGVTPEVQWSLAGAGVYFSLGLGVALLGCAGPAWEAARAAPAQALKSGSEAAALAKWSKTRPALACLLLAASLSFAPPVFELPLFGYCAIALMLIGAIGLMPQLAALVFRSANRLWMRRQQHRNNPAGAVLTLTLARLANASGQAGVALGGVLSSFSLMVAMAIMVASFRVSVDDWLLQILPADLYARTATSGNTAGLDRREQAMLMALPLVARIDFLRSRPLTLAADRPNVVLLARAIDSTDPGKTMVMLGASLPAPNGSMPVWISEAVVDVYGITAGSMVQLPLNGKLQPFFVAGVWRDYARQAGAIQMRLPDYQALTGDFGVNDAGFWLQPGALLADLEGRLKRLPFGATLELAAPSAIRATSLKIFDRSFAVTYLLEAVAMIIGLFGIGATFSAQTLARAREFGMLRHIGVTRRQILAILAIEGGALTALGIACGFILGLLISLILVFIVNPQSFHWSMQLHVPGVLLANVAGALLLAAALTALVSGRYALSGGPIKAVKEDW